MPLEHHSQPLLALHSQTPHSCPRVPVAQALCNCPPPKSPQPLRAVCCCKSPPQLVGQCRPPWCPVCTWQCSSRWAGWDSRELKCVVGGFYKFNAVPAPATVLGLYSPLRNTPHTPSCHLSQAYGFPRAAQETLWRRTWVTAHQQTFPWLLRAHSHSKKASVGGARSPAVECLG